MRIALGAGALALACGCGRPALQPAAVEPHHLVSCPGTFPARVEARFEAGHSLADVITWYAAATCRVVAVDRAHLNRRSPHATIAVIARDRVDELFDAALAELGFVAVRRGERVVVVAGKSLRLFVPTTPR